jgi:hypothetical protein
MKKRKITFAEVPEPQTKGMNQLERAFHVLDEEAEILAEWPEEVLIRLGQIEHCYTIMYTALLRHLPEDIRMIYPPAPRKLERIVEDNLRTKREAK